MASGERAFRSGEGGTVTCTQAPMQDRVFGGHGPWSHPGLSTCTEYTYGRYSVLYMEAAVWQGQGWVGCAGLYVCMDVCTVGEGGEKEGSVRLWRC